MLGLFNALGLHTIHHTQDCPLVLTLGHYELHRICGSTEYAANLGTHLYGGKHVDRKGIPYEDYEEMPGTNSLSSLYGSLGELLVIAIVPDQPLLGSLTETDPESYLRNRTRESLIEIFNCLDEVGLTCNDISTLRNLDWNSLKLHRNNTSPALYDPATRRNPYLKDIPSSMSIDLERLTTTIAHNKIQLVSKMEVKR